MSITTRSQPINQCIPRRLYVSMGILKGLLEVFYSDVPIMTEWRVKKEGTANITGQGTETAAGAAGAAQCGPPLQQRPVSDRPLHHYPPPVPFPAPPVAVYLPMFAS
jgi:hypothetical protein